ncbi:MAG: diaminopimelate epimerase [Bacteroidetes bacterium]|nr:MAG: diaminopimelate epimerase [Bacteroidota bacterium]MBL1144316.1 diaminopimelate epimerase [Bacteroidota bacterium]MCB0801594.1 diaminopimelate epimerase [Flavobacteriales bacterium]NOG57112.1 diaminopimelate epimerase [Bacteroidota bacterium]
MEFYKYQGTGNDFIMIDGFQEKREISISEVRDLCHRRFGIGADGLIILKKRDGYDFEMDYFNADGSKSFCGNGSRCAQAFANFLGLIKTDSKFYAIDGAHQGKKIGEDFGTLMRDVTEVQELGLDYFLNTGSPHYVKYVNDVDSVDVTAEGKAIRYSELYKKEGTNVNFVSIHEGFLKVRTYERGVEAETLSCGTGVTAVAISYLYKTGLKKNEIAIKTSGGDLRILLNRKSKTSFQDIWLIGPAVKVFKGNV